VVKEFDISVLESSKVIEGSTNQAKTTISYFYKIMWRTHGTAQQATIADYNTDKLQINVYAV